MNKILIIIKREYLQAVKKKTFLVMTILGPLLMAGLIITPTLLANYGKDNQTIAVLDESGLFSKLNSPNDKSIHFTYVDKDLLVLKKELIDKKYDALLYIPYNSTILGGMIYSTSSLGTGVISSVLAAMKRDLSNEILLNEFNISQDSLNMYIENQTNKIMLGQTFIDKNGEESKKASYLKEIQLVIGYISGILIYLFIFMYCSMVLRNVLEEKTNRIVEIIVSSVKPIQLMIGKIVGVALIGLTQLMIWIISLIIILGIVRSSFPEMFERNNTSIAVSEQMPADYYKYIPSDAQNGINADESIVDNEFVTSLMEINFVYLIVFFLFFFVTGYFFYASLYAAIGGAVDNDTDTQQFMLPLTLPLLLTFIVSQYIAENPDGALAFWFSIIPFTSPIAMMIRMPFGMEAVQSWEIILSCSLMVLGCVASAWIAAKIYRTGILMYGKKITYKELWKWIRYKN
ncbi:MAG: ABC-2 family transporter protein [Bacteroidetes bacterium ADurb.Bin234]|jgi:ABC-2 type transport system permease protein|nr:MAG: ABC-2 family transporter protein [Bacteroidetes bacterium ADurb.Bin234]